MIDHPPSVVRRFFQPVTAPLSEPQRSHLVPLVLAIAVGWRCSKPAHLAATIKDGRHRTRLGGFLRREWDETAVLSDRAPAPLKRMLTHHAITGVGARARTPHTDLELPRWNDRRASPPLRVRPDQVPRLIKGSKHRRLRMKIEPYLIAA